MKRNFHPKSESESEWRKRQILLPEELVMQLFEWHGGQASPTYALASSGMRELVSLSMIDASMRELELARVATRGNRRKEVDHVLAELDTVRKFWKEHSAKEAGLGLTESDYEYDRANYGMGADEEAAISTRSG